MQSIVALPALVAAAPVALVECDLLDGSVRSWNPAAEALFKRSAESVLGRECPLFDAIEHDHAGELLRQDVRSALPFRDRELTVQRPDGSSVEIRLSSAPVLDEAGETVSVALVAIDITAQHRHLRELRHFANHDPLTDLQNRRSFERALARIVGRARRGGPSGVLFVIDLDLLKQVNDRLGHLAGDALLIAVANVLRGTMRPRDLVARLGGDEFGVVVEGVTAGEARAIADRVRTSIGRQRIGPEGAGHSTASIGGIVIDGTRSPAELLAAADEALYVAKRRRDSAEIHLEAATGPKVETNGAAARLRRALSVDGISVQYQPVIDLRSGILHSQEALARVRLDREFHIASEFIELARAAGLIGEIDRRVVMLVLRHLAEPTQTPLSLNLSGGSLGDRRLLDLLRSCAPSGGYGGRLIVEAKESDVHADPRRAFASAGAVTELGIAVAVDDFGTNQQALAALDGLPFSMVKLDSSIVTSLSGAAAFDTVSEVVQACASRGITVVAKGIEQPSTVDVLTSLGVTLGQGYLLSQPHAAVTLANVLETIREFGEANLPLIAWEFTVPERVVESAWSHVLAEGLIESSGIDEDTGEGMYRLTHRGELRVDELRDGGGSDH